MMNPDTPLPQGTRIRFTLTALASGIGTICGYSGQEQPIIGRGMIVGVEKWDQENLVDYPYTHIVVFEVQIKSILTGCSSPNTHQKGDNDET